MKNQNARKCVNICRQFSLDIKFWCVILHYSQRSGLAVVLVFTFVQPGLKPKLFTDDEIRYKCSIEFRSPEMQADFSKTADDLFLSQHSGKPHVVCSLPCSHIHFHVTLPFAVNFLIEE